MTTNLTHHKTIKIGYLVSYDWKLLKISLPLVYEEADIIVLALDFKRRTWAGNYFEFDEQAFQQFITEADTQNKIELYQDDFYDPALTTMQNEIRERNLLAKKMGSGGWHLQIDADEYLIDFQSFVKKLKHIDPNPQPERIKRPVNVLANFITIIKKVPEGYIYVEPSLRKRELVPVATQVPCYEYGRRNGYFNIHTTLLVIHESRSRSNEEFYFKLRNWGHNKDFRIESYYAIWKAIDGFNYRFIKDFNPLGKNDWPALKLAAVQNIPELIQHIKSIHAIKSDLSMYISNSRNFARIKKLINILFRM